MEIEYNILRNCANSLIWRIDDLENKVIDNEDKLINDVHYEMSNFIAYYRSNFRQHYSNPPVLVVRTIKEEGIVRSHTLESYENIDEAIDYLIKLKKETEN